MRANRFVWLAWGAVAVVTALRATFATTLPLTGDEAYYWEWSRRLAAGYVDHPPAVAFAVAAFSWLGRTPVAVRLAFLLCGLGTALAAGGAAAVLARNARAGAIAALAVSLAPIMNVGFAVASPDGPYALGWACSLLFAALAFRDRRLQWFVLLGAALGVTLLSRFFGFALVAGIAAAACLPQYRSAWRSGFWLSLALAFAMYAPFLFWNANHHWVSVTFALLGRHPDGEVAPLRPAVLYVLDALAFSPGLWIAATLFVVRPREPLIAWTALPLCALLFVLAVHERVEVYWFTGPFISLCVGLGLRRIESLWVWAPAAALSAVVFAAAVAPLPLYGALARAGLHLSDGGPFEMFTYQRLATDVGSLARRHQAVVMTDGYGFSSLLDFYGNVTPVVIGYDTQGEESERWFKDASRPGRALFVDKVPLSRRPDFSIQLNRACSRVVPGPVLAYQYRRYFTTWCEGMVPNAVATLRWRTAKS